MKYFCGNDDCMALISSGHAVSLPPIVNDDADALYWLQAIDSPMVLQSVSNVLAYHLLRVCIVDEKRTFSWHRLPHIYYFETI